MEPQKRNRPSAPPLSLLITEIAKLFHDKMNKSSEKLGFKNGYRPILRHLAHEDGVTQIDLVRATHLKPPTISVTLKKMEQEGLVRRVTDKNDLRQTHVFLTDQGRDMEYALFCELISTDEVLLQGLSEEELQAFRGILLKLRRNMLNEMGLPEDWRPRP